MIPFDLILEHARPPYGTNKKSLFPSIPIFRNIIPIPVLYQYNTLQIFQRASLSNASNQASTPQYTAVFLNIPQYTAVFLNIPQYTADCQEYLIGIIPSIPWSLCATYTAIYRWPEIYRYYTGIGIYRYIGIFRNRPTLHMGFCRYPGR